MSDSRTDEHADVERTDVEISLALQLQAMNLSYFKDNADALSLIGRRSFGQVLMTHGLQQAVRTDGEGDEEVRGLSDEEVGAGGVRDADIESFLRPAIGCQLTRYHRDTDEKNNPCGNNGNIIQAR
ncbi:MAG: hypothetical protein L6435_02320 [Anaerolineae bacterium]|nr:hypothetical protein [Anaerolineae bacterium]